MYLTVNSDLNLKIDENKGTPMCHDGFAMMWAGARATYGVKRGSVAFEVKVCVINCTE